MSYDVSVGRECFNYTSNLGPLFYAHIPASEGGRGGIHELDGLTGKQAGAVLRSAISSIDSEICGVGHKSFCGKFDANNGWGSAIGGVVFLARILGECTSHPRCIVRVSA